MDVEQDPSARVAGWDPTIAPWTLTPVEVGSALRRLVREGTLDETVARLAEVRLDEPMAAGHVDVDADPVKALAARLWPVHPPRALGALPPGAALHRAEGHPRKCSLSTVASP